MTAASEPGPRIVALDVVRGVAVLGILAMNIVAFAMPFNAYMNPAAYGLESNLDLASWAISFVFVDGKMRGLFSFLFGASALLVIERAQASGQSAARVHYSRMLWLLVFGLAHFYFIWFGDILSGYALLGLILYFFRNMAPRRLVVAGGILIVVQLIFFLGITFATGMLREAATAPRPNPKAMVQWQEMSEQFGALSAQGLADKLSLFHGPYIGLVRDRLIERGAEPFESLLFFGWETLAYMLFGMAALKTGFFKGKWRALDYFKVAVMGFAITVPAYALLAWVMASDGFSIPIQFAVGLAATVPFRPLMVLAYAALIILLASRTGWLTARLAAAGRAAFSNYLGTSLIMTTLFYGYGVGLYGTMSRAELWLVVLPMWALMLLWSKPWLDRFRYGPFEWLWRSLSRWRLEPMRRSAPAAR